MASGAGAVRARNACNPGNPGKRGSPTRLSGRVHKTIPGGSTPARSIVRGPRGPAAGSIGRAETSATDCPWRVHADLREAGRSEAGRTDSGAAGKSDSRSSTCAASGARFTALERVFLGGLRLSIGGGGCYAVLPASTFRSSSRSRASRASIHTAHASPGAARGGIQVAAAARSQSDRRSS